MSVHGRHLVPRDAHHERFGLLAHPLGVIGFVVDVVLAELEATAYEDGNFPPVQAERGHVPLHLSRVVDGDLIGAGLPPFAAVRVGLDLQPADHAPVLQQQPVGIGEHPVPFGVQPRPGLDELEVRVLCGEPVRHPAFEEVAAGLVVVLRVRLDETRHLAPGAVPGRILRQADDPGDARAGHAVLARLVPLVASGGPPAEVSAGGGGECGHQNGGSSWLR